MKEKLELFVIIDSFGDFSSDLAAGELRLSRQFSFVDHEIIEEEEVSLL